MQSKRQTVVATHNANVPLVNDVAQGGECEQNVAGRSQDGHLGQQLGVIHIRQTLVKSWNLYSSCGCGARLWVRARCASN